MTEVGKILLLLAVGRRTGPVSLGFVVGSRPPAAHLQVEKAE